MNKKKTPSCLMNKNQIQSCIEHVPIFDALNQSEKDEVILLAQHENYGKNEFIYMSGDELEALYVVHKGSVKIIRYTIDGKEQVLRILKHGDFFGETALFANKKVNNYAEILEDTIICKIDQSSFNQMINKKPTIARKMLLELSNRLDYIEESVTFNNLKTAESKLAKYLLDNQKNELVKLNTTKKNISAFLGITPETFSRRLKTFENEGHIKQISNTEILIINKKYFEDLIYL